ncbi:B3 domain-containing protein At5g24050-like [Bidens hawaiensis]|uniref:B3 domain-containing protein At5g24050-like n=1 Tax=Bidens hawaiensis TaxID=980011 RepID=UPI00404AE921
MFSYIINNNNNNIKIVCYYDYELRLLLPIKKRCFTTAFEDKYDHQQVKRFNQEWFLPIKKRCFVTFEDDQQVKKLTEDAIIKKPESVLMEKKKKRKMPKKMVHGLVVNNDSTDQLKRFITGEMFGLDMKLVIQKSLYESDLNTTQNRLNMPVKQLVTRPHEFLTDDEMRVIEDGGKDGMEVKVVGPTMKMFEKPLRLKTWHMKNTDNFVLKTNWNEFVGRNKMVLKTYTMVQVWSFRKERELCFAIVPV